MWVFTCVIGWLIELCVRLHAWRQQSGREAPADGRWCCEWICLRCFTLSPALLNKLRGADFKTGQIISYHIFFLFFVYLENRVKSQVTKKTSETRIYSSRCSEVNFSYAYFSLHCNKYWWKSSFFARSFSMTKNGRACCWSYESGCWAAVWKGRWGSLELSALAQRKRISTECGLTDRKLQKAAAWWRCSCHCDIRRSVLWVFFSSFFF